MITLSRNITIEEAAEHLIDAVKVRFPHFNEFGRRFDNPDSPNKLRIYVKIDGDEDTEIAMREYSSGISVDIMLETGHRVALVPCLEEYELLPD
jgi:hypothetical protein